jgi:rubrerythrin
MDWINFMKAMAMEEHAARARYNWAAEMADSPQLRAVFEKLRDEEAFHAQFLEGEQLKLEKLLASAR